MDIANAKEQIKHTVQIYLQKDALGCYQVPVVHQRPVFLSGAPGLGKTAIVGQIAEELGLGLVSYSMTHHTRQSALGLPMIVEKEYGGKTYSVSEYTMSEIIAAMYDCMRSTGKTEGILFLDEINCVSETLSPAMLLFLQYKVFGGHQIPEGWVVVTAGNPPRFNKSAREFDAATRDRLKVIEIEPDYEMWRKYALEKGISSCILSYLDIRQDDFYRVETTVDGFTVVTPRAWEDLSQCLRQYEEHGFSVDERLTGQYLQNKTTARDFAIYYELYRKYRQVYQIDQILMGDWGEDVLQQAGKAALDERISLVGLLVESVSGQMLECTRRHDALALIAAWLKEQRNTLNEQSAPQNALTKLTDDLRVKAKTALDPSVYLQAAEFAKTWSHFLDEEDAFALIAGYYKTEVSLLRERVAITQKEIGNMMNFLRAAFGRGTELNIAVNDLTVTPAAAAFIGQFLSEDYLAASQGLQLHQQEEELLRQIDLSGMI